MITTTPYESRTPTEPAPVPRREPVVWGGVDDGPLDAEQLATFDERGFLTFDGVLDVAEVAELTRRVEAICADPRHAEDERLIREPDSDVVRSIFEVQRFDPVLAALAADERLTAAARQLVGSDVYLHQTRVNLKPGFHGTEFAWHSDFETWHVEDGLPEMRTVSAVIALTENRIDNGSLMIVPGSHRTFVGCAGATPADNHRSSLRRQEVGTPSDAALAELVGAHGIVTITGGPGSVLLFDSNCMHGSNGNITPFPRSNLFFVYNSVENAPVDPFGGTAPRPTHVAARTVEPLG